METAWDNVFHVLNPNGARRAAVQAFVDQRSWKRIWIERTSHPTHLETAMEWAVNEGQRDVAIWGGDGTLSRAVNVLSNIGALDRVRLLLVPCGTCNDFARKLELPSWEIMAKRAAPLAERRVDLGTLSHAEGRRVFVNNAGFGRRPEARRERRPNPVMDIFRLEALPVQIEAANGGSTRHEIRALLGIVFNAPYFGGGLHFSKSIAPDDGRLDAVFLDDQPRWQVLWSFLRGRSGRPFSNRRAVAVSGATIRVRSSRELFPQADGEKASDGGVRELSFEVLPRALTLLLPNENLRS